MELLQVGLGDSMTWAEIRAAVRMKLADDGKIWTDAELLENANAVLDELCVDSEAHIKTYSMELDGTRRYTFPSDYHELRGVRINGRPISGVRSHDLEDWDAEYLTRAGTTEWFYVEDTRSIAFYRVPDWTDDYTAGSFDSESGVVTSLYESDYWTMDGENGIVTSIIDDSMQKKFIQSGWNGCVCGLNDGALVVHIRYVYQPARIVHDADTPDLPGYMHYGLEFGVLKKAFGRAGQGKNQTLENWYGSRYTSFANYWESRNKEWAHGEDQMVTVRPATWGSEYAKKMWRER